ncbi:6-carboxy-5,6,7,8-tetrahydropterin synthase [Gimesia chilikensis]|uniref:6-carboxy-5,6,7,8-tetrahydropterin synthase n=1 Tax=Gimesia chilikensis TaxID=2605989 RepID=A0A517W830_9PLAN|nr:6-pyruvoyl tetrahydropterin synthase family protein [Gimesia chilikensis]QDU01402.1 6-carboxy-5,6,7,8-tetrahydropterin synthase [Gimesia chilikensis]
MKDSVPRYKVRVTKDHLVFSAAHFITFNGNICERLHGHNWRVAAELTGPLDENGYVFDFIALRDQLQKTVDALDHRVLLPTQHDKIKVREDQNEVEATFEERRWVFPREDCILLPIANTTAELIAHWIGQQLMTVIGSDAATQIESVQIEVEENFGQWAICELPVTRN